MRERETVDLIADERCQRDDHHRVSPQLVSPQRDYQHEFHCAVRQKIPGSKVFSASPKVYEIVPQMPGNKVMAIFREFRSDEGRDHPVDCVQWNPEENNSSNQLGERAEPLQSDAYKKAFMKN